MKRIISTALCIMVLVIMAAVPVKAAYYVSDSDKIWNEDQYSYYELNCCNYVGNRTLRSVEFSENVTEIEDGAFEDCVELESIIVNKNLKRIGKNAFKSTAYYMDSSNWEKGVLYLGDCLIKADPNQIGETYTIKDDTRLIADGAFEGCSQLKNVYIPDTVKFIGRDAFAGTALINNVEIWKDGFLCIDGYLISAKADVLTETLVIPDFVTCIGDAVFENCVNVKYAVISDSVKYLGNKAFFGCENLETVSLGKRFKDIGLEVFEKCPSLSRFSVSEQNVYFKAGAGILYNAEETSIIKCPAKFKGELIIPETVSRVEPFAFRACEFIESVVLPRECIYVGKYAFADCKSLKTITFGGKIGIVAKGAFSNCDAIEEFNVDSDTLYCVGANCFEGCDALSEVSIRADIYSVSKGAFKDCISLQNVDIRYASFVEEGAFEGSGVINDYSCWENGMLIVGGYLIKVAAGTTVCEVPEKVVAIADSAFADTLDTLEQVKLHKGIKGFGFGVFKDFGHDILVHFDGSMSEFYDGCDFDPERINLVTKDQDINTLLLFLMIGIAFAFIAILSRYDTALAEEALRAIRKKEESESGIEKLNVAEVLGKYKTSENSEAEVSGEAEDGVESEVCDNSADDNKGEM